MPLLYAMNRKKMPDFSAERLMTVPQRGPLGLYSKSPA